MKKTLSIVLLVLLVFLAVACSPEHKHDYKLVPEKSIEATCTSNGFNYMECSCGAIQSIPTAALGHDYVENTEKYIAPTCKTEGQRVSVCSRCDDEKTTTLAKDPNNHPYYLNIAEAGEPANYVGVFGNVKEFTTLPTCANDGVGVFTKCTACNKTGEFTVVVPSDDFLAVNSKTYPNGHVELNAKGDGLVAVEKADVKDWEITKEATAFVSGLQTAVCPTCGQLFAKDVNDEGLVDDAIKTKPDLALGNWTVAKEDSQHKTVEKYFLDLSKKLGNYYASAYYMKKVEGVETTDDIGDLSSNLTITGFGMETLNGSAKVTGYNDAVISETAFGFQVGAVYYAIAEITDATGMTGYKDGDCVLLNSASDWGTTVSWDLVGEAVLSEHVHSFELMSGRGAVVDNWHYLECACGLQYVKEEHGDEECDRCGHDSSWITVALTDYEVFSIDPTVAYYLPGTEEKGTQYTINCFSGEAKKYNAIGGKPNNTVAVTGKTGYYTSSADSTWTLTNK